MSSSRSRYSTFLECVVLILMGRQMTDLWLVERYEVTSGSMSPTLRGAHYRLRCPYCDHEHSYDLDRPPLEGQKAFCPRCQAYGSVITDQPLHSGDRVWIDRSAFMWRAPRRGEVIAFRAPHCSSEVHVKRVVGLPGEVVEIRQGVVFINGREADGLPSGARYTVPPGMRGALGIEVPQMLYDAFFVLGDHSELAIDSRYPSYGPIDAKLLVGKPIGVH